MRESGARGHGGKMKETNREEQEVAGGRGGAFARSTAAVLARFCAQNGQSAPARSELEACGKRLKELIHERGWPKTRGMRGELAETEVAALAGRVLGEISGDARAPLEVAARQLVKASFYGGLETCCESCSEVAADGACRRQEWARARGRVSGAHCVDCPQWGALDAEAHGAFLRARWRGPDAGEFDAHAGIFLPEDFRAWRRDLESGARIKS